MPDFEGNYFKPTPENLQKRRDTETRVLTGFREAISELDSQCRSAFGISPDASDAEVKLKMEELAPLLSCESTEVDRQTVISVFLRGKPLFIHTLPSMVMDGPAKGSIQYRFKLLEEDEDGE